MPHLENVDVHALAPQRFREVIPADRYDKFAEAFARAHTLLEGRVVWNVNSTAKGGGVAEMLQSLLAYAKGAGVDARWVVIEGDPDFFSITKRIHNHLHGAGGDKGELGDREHSAYEHTLEANGTALLEEVKSGDVVLLHDPQTAGLTRVLKEAVSTCPTSSPGGHGVSSPPTSPKLTRMSFRGRPFNGKACRRTR
jgi:trehalose synthase